MRKGKTTIVAYSDLLGFGNMIGSSSGTLDSAVGEVALKRIEGLREALFTSSALFPDGTKFFHLNDLALATFDVDVVLETDIINSEAIYSHAISRQNWISVLKFVSASASLHEAIITIESKNRIGPASRTFVVIGQRWEIDSSRDHSSISHIPEFQGNMALAEAYQADSLGSKSGFEGIPCDRFYLNDLAWHAVRSGIFPFNIVVREEELKRLNLIGIREKEFPFNLKRRDPIEVSIFHRKRRFFPVISNHACKIYSCLDEE